MKNSNLEIRSIVSEIRSLEEESRKISGLAIPAEARSELLYGEFYETISKDALTEDLINSMDIKLYVNHDASQGTFARSKYGKGSLRLFVTDRGIEFETELPNTAQGDMLLEGIRRGDYDALSFAFAPEEDEWTENEDGTYNRTIRSIAFLDEISLLSVAPAYEQTEVNCRSLENFKEEQRQAKEQKDKEILDSLDAKIKEFEEAAKV
ncbi:MAG: HK97 family phage prohead protease [Methanobrevibacter sp.]|nr:HK97 family phage prohead protease [Methanobrevibacter sp.]